MKNPFKKSARAALDDAERHSEKMIAELEAATEVLVQATEARVAASGQPDDVLDALDEKYERAKKLMERAQERLQIAGEAVDQAQAVLDAELAAERQAKAKALRSKLEPKIAEHYAEAARAALLTLRTIAQADLELETLECNGDGKSSVAIERGARFKDWLGEVEISRQEVDLWSDRSGLPLEVQPRPAEIGKDREGHFLVGDGGLSAGGVRFDVQMRKFVRVEFKNDALNRRTWVKPLAASLQLPGIGDPDEPLWPPRAPIAIADEPARLVQQVEEALARLADQLRALRERHDNRLVLVRLDPIQQDGAVEMLKHDSALTSEIDAADISVDDDAYDDTPTAAPYGNERQHG